MVKTGKKHAIVCMKFEKGALKLCKMGKPEQIKQVTASEINCLENLVVAYNTVFLMSSIFIVSIAGTVRELFSDFCRILSPSLILLIIGCFIVFIAGIGYVGIGKKSSSLISLYTMLLIFVLIWEISAGFGILSFRREIRSTVSNRMKKTIAAYPDDPLTANLVDYAQLELQCCGVKSFRDWEGILDSKFPTMCKTADFNLPSSCCTRFNDSTVPEINKNGCLPAVVLVLHRSTLFLTTTVIAICTIQILGAYFSYTLAKMLSKYKIQAAVNSERERAQYDVDLPIDYKEKSNYF